MPRRILRLFKEVKGKIRQEVVDERLRRELPKAIDLAMKALECGDIALAFAPLTAAIERVHYSAPSRLLRPAPTSLVISDILALKGEMIHFLQELFESCDPL